MYTRLVAALFGLAIGLPVAFAQEQETWRLRDPLILPYGINKTKPLLNRRLALDACNHIPNSKYATLQTFYIKTGRPHPGNGSEDTTS